MSNLIKFKFIYVSMIEAQVLLDVWISIDY